MCRLHSRYCRYWECTVESEANGVDIIVNKQVVVADEVSGRPAPWKIDEMQII